MVIMAQSAANWRNTHTHVYIGTVPTTLCEAPAQLLHNVESNSKMFYTVNTLSDDYSRTQGKKMLSRFGTKIPRHSLHAHSKFLQSSTLECVLS